MDKKKTLIMVALALVLLIAVAAVLYEHLGENWTPDQLAAPETSPAGGTETQPPRIPAPDFTVYDRDGNAVKLSDYFGKPIILNFWASWCGPCKMEMPDFNEKARDLAGEVHFLMINMTDGDRETVETASAFIEEQGYTFPVFYDTTFEAAYTYGAYSLPTTYFIDADGYAVTMASGAISADTLQRGIDMIYTP